MAPGWETAWFSAQERWALLLALESPIVRARWHDTRVPAREETDEISRFVRLNPETLKP